MRPIVPLLLALALPLAAGCDRQKAPEPQASAGEAEGAKGIDRSHKGEAAPTVKFKDPDGGEFQLTGGVKGNTTLQGPVNYDQEPTPDPLAYLPEPSLPSPAIAWRFQSKTFFSMSAYAPCDTSTP